MTSPEGYRPPLSEIQKHAENATDRAKERRADAKKQRSMRAVAGVAVAGLATAAALKIGARNVEQPNLSGERQTPGRTAPVRPEVQAMEARDRNIQASNAIGGAPIMPEVELENPE